VVLKVSTFTHFGLSIIQTLLQLGLQSGLSLFDDKNSMSCCAPTEAEYDGDKDLLSALQSKIFQIGKMI